ncbi:hypothetical protein LQ567_03645 [Niabella pedocola]|uniref:C-type lysozyme inhibitor domain-containing protein n=1 Tax=Niabella pedocola TaxID=1752077 RepID=A0ABS8PLU0_9BACT|nr:hypothetical protein [Niabella pedocola]MCD2421840.1 hypothetical protein [Niabella pedocola]
MKKCIYIILMVSIAACLSKGKSNLYDLDNYYLVPDPNNSLDTGGRLYLYKKDTSYSALKINKGAGDSVIVFFHKMKKNGPFTVYLNGKIGFKHNYKNGVQDGAQLWFNENGDTTSREYYKDGVKME